ncbi:hypothetical protein AAE478_005366 [Parahypoxylon ruwenzoriense]
MDTHNYPDFPFLDQEINEIRRYFDQADQSRFRWVGPLKATSYALYVRVRVAVFVSGKKGWKDYVVKRPLGNGEALLEDDMQKLRQLRGPHLTRQLVLANNPLEEPLLHMNNPDELLPWGDQLSNSGSGPYPVPYLLLEYFENGTLGDLIRKARAQGLTRLPDIFLWGLFRCLIRACFDMQYPGSERETDQERRSRGPTMFIHPNLTLENVMVGRSDTSFDHRCSPILKVAGLGRRDSDERPYGLESEKENLLAAGMIMQNLIALTDSEDEQYKERRWCRPRSAATTQEKFETFATLLEPSLTEEDIGSVAEPPFPWVGSMMRYAVCKCTAVNPAQRLSLDSAVLVPMTSFGLTRKVEQEDVAAIRRLLERPT